MALALKPESLSLGRYFYKVKLGRKGIEPLTTRGY
jgi:hypothetical protein